MLKSQKDISPVEQKAPGPLSYLKNVGHSCASLGSLRGSEEEKGCTWHFHDIFKNAYV